MKYSKDKLKINSDKAPPCFRPFWIGNASDKFEPMQNLLKVSFKHIAISC